MESLQVLPLKSDTYEAALEAACIGIWDYDLINDEVVLGGYSYQLFEVPRGTILKGADWLDRIYPGDRERTDAELKASMDPVSKKLYENEYRIIDAGTGAVMRWVRAKGRFYFSGDGAPVRFTGSWQDISAEVNTREAQQKLLTLVDNSIELMSVLEKNGRNSYINKAGMEMLGFDTLEQVHSTPITELHTPEDLRKVQADILESVRNIGRWSGTMNVRHLKTGEVFPVYNNTVRINDPFTGEHLATGAVMRDMRPEIAARKALEESERNFRNLVMQAPVGICIIKAPDFEVEEANDSFLAIADVTRDELIGHRLGDVFPAAAGQGFMALFRNVLETGKPYYGSEVPVHQTRGKSPGSTYYVDFTFQPLFDTDGTVSRIIDISIDVTDKVMAKKQLLENEEELQRRVSERTAELEKKNRELEEFNYVTSHDLQEPLRKMKIYRQMIRDRDYNNLSDFSKEKFDKVGESVDRMSKTLKDLLTYTSLSLEEQAEPVDLNDVLRMVESDLELLIEQKGARLHKTPLPSVKGVPLQMHRLFYNLVNNALKFSRSDAAPVIEIHAGKLPRERHGGFPLLTAGQAYYEIVVSDNGIGFEQDKAERIFGMFQRLHSREEYSGTGIGLALCRKVVNNHGGHIYANATPGKGTRFHILLPENE